MSRTVHGYTAQGHAIVRYTPARKWWIEGGHMIHAEQVTVTRAAIEASRGRWIAGLPGGSRFDDLVRQELGIDKDTEVYNDRPRQCPECHQPFPGYREFWAHAENDHDWHWVDGKISPRDSKAIGMGRSALYVLGIWPAPRVHRETVRALARVNRGDGKNSREHFRRSLSAAERDGLLRRVGDYIDVLDREALYARAVSQIADPTHEKFLALRDAIPTIAAQIAAERDAKARRARERELAFIRSLMRPYDRPMTGSRRPVRVVAAGRPS